jgi:hypothetical protein
MRDGYSQGATGVGSLTAEVVRILSRALRAAHFYERLRPASDQLLAEQGLTHGDLPRAAYRVLTEDGP